MKNLLFTSLLLFATVFFASAEGVTKSGNDAAMKAGHKQAAAKTALLTTSITNHDAATTQATAADLLIIMRKGLMQTMSDMNLRPAAERKDANVHYLQLEKTIYNFRLASEKADNTQMLQHAQDFLKEY